MSEFFVPIENTKPYLKLAAEGFAGTGKTYSLAQIAAGLHAHIHSTKPVAIFDTERAAKFLRPFFAERGIPAVVKESRSMADLKEAFRVCREGFADILVIDSITHVWEDFLAAYQQRVRRQRLEFQDWGVIKPTWKAEFSTPFVNDPVHCLMAGRAGYEYANEKNEETGKREIYKSGIKMKVEGETAYEPDILLLMERFEEVLTDEKRVWRECTVLKDRSTRIDGKTFRNPTFEDFLPAITAILDAPAAAPSTQAGDAGRLFHTEEDKREFTRARDIACEEIEGLLVSRWPGQSKEEKKAKADALEWAFGTRSWTAIKQMHPDRLNEGLQKLIDRDLEAASKANVEEDFSLGDEGLRPGELPL